jgi:hypothetical protein
VATSRKAGRPGRPRIYGKHDSIAGLGPHGALAWADEVWAGRPERLSVEAVALVEAAVLLPVVGRPEIKVEAAADDPVAVAAVIATVVGAADGLVGAPVLEVS